MSYEPPIPNTSRSPYPIEEAPHSTAQLPPVAANEAEPTSLQQRAQDLVDTVTDIDVDSRTLVGIGAAIALGAAATVAAVFLGRRRPQATPRKRPAAKARPAKPARTRKVSSKKTA